MSPYPLYLCIVIGEDTYLVERESILDQQLDLHMYSSTHEKKDICTEYCTLKETIYSTDHKQLNALYALNSPGWSEGSRADNAALVSSIRVLASSVRVRVHVR